MYPEDEESVPDTIRFAPRDWETPTQKTKVMFFAATCPLGRLVLKELNVTGHMNKKGKQAKGVDSAFLIKSGVFCEVYRALKRLCKPDQTPFLIIDKATVHTSKVMREHLDSIFTSDGWMFQAAKMPDSNDGDVGLFPFMKREVAKLGGGHDARRDRHVCEEGVDARDAESVQEHPRPRHSKLEVGGRERRQELLRRVHDQGRVRPVGGRFS